VYGELDQRPVARSRFRDRSAATGVLPGYALVGIDWVPVAVLRRNVRVIGLREARTEPSACGRGRRMKIVNPSAA
jgi:hypothetical protein